jgi:hypothetical protein
VGDGAAVDGRCIRHCVGILRQGIGAGNRATF